MSRPAGLPLQATEAASDTLGGAIEVAGQLPDQLGPALIDAARDAFTQGLHVGAAISAIGTVSLAVFVLVLLRRVRPGSESQDQPAPEPDGVAERVP